MVQSGTQLQISQLFSSRWYDGVALGLHLHSRTGAQDDFVVVGSTVVRAVAGRVAAAVVVVATAVVLLVSPAAILQEHVSQLLASR